MRTTISVTALVLIFTAVCAAERDWEVGGAVGYGWYRNGNVYSPSGKVTAGIRNRFVAGFVVAEESYEHVSGEFRYLFHDGDPFLSSGNAKTNVQGQSHAFHYDVLVHAFDKESKVRPYFAVGGGVKRFVVTGPAPRTDVFPTIATLNSEDQTQPLLTVGPGVKVRLSPHALVRFDFRDYITPFPKHVIAPANLGTARGILHQFTPLFGISYVF